VGAIRWKREGKLNFPTNTTVGSTEDNNLLTEIEEASREWINSRVLMDKIQREEEKKETDLLAPFKKRIDDLTDELRDANKRLADTNREISRLQSNSSATSNQVSDLTNKLQTANTEIIRLQNEITQLKKAASIVSAVVSSSSPPPASVATDPREASIRSVLDSINTDVKAKTNAIIQLALFSSNGSGLTENEKDNNLKIVTSMILTISQFTEAQFQAATKQLRQPSLTLSPLPSSSSSSSSTNPPSLSVRMFQLYAMTL
jgi:chromosome segregation ATPase